MAKFSKGFMVGAATAAHQVEGNNVHSDYWVQENIEHSSFVEPSGEAVDHYHRYEEKRDSTLTGSRLSGRASSPGRIRGTRRKSSITAR